MGKNKYYTYSFEKLEVWKLARKIRNQIYELSEDFPNVEKFGVTSQIRRSSNRVTDNIAEGSGRASNTDRAHFTNIAFSSVLETINHLITCHDQKYISTDTYEKKRIQLDELINKLNSFYRHQLNEGRSVKEKFRE
ncbi:MAG: four helix bundle protein [Balneolaceae bacterium]